VCLKDPSWGHYFFSVYIGLLLPLQLYIAQSRLVFQQQYADDTQRYVALSPLDYRNELITLQSCLSSLHIWFCENGMALNPSKSDAILFGTSQQLKTMSGLTSVKIADLVIQFSDSIKILGTTLDANLNMGPYTKAISKSCFYHIRSFRQIRSSVDCSMAVSVASALVSSRFDYANSVFARDSVCCSAHMLSQFRPSVRLSARLSLTRVIHAKTVVVRIVQLSPHSSPIPLVFAR